MPLIFTVNDGMVGEIMVFNSRLASLLTITRRVKKSQVTAWVRTKINYEIWYYVDHVLPPQETKNIFSVIPRNFLSIPILYLLCTWVETEGSEKPWESEISR